jgi:hypothetical protein
MDLADTGTEQVRSPLPYLNCPNCRLTVYRPPSITTSERCSRCGVQLGEAARSLFPPDQISRISAARVRETLRERATRREAGLSA